MRLDELSQGGVALVAAVGGEGTFRRRLLELGLLPGTPVTRVGEAPMGDPLLFRLRGATLSIRRSDAALVEVRLP